MQRSFILAVLVAGEACSSTIAPRAGAPDASTPAEGGSLCGNGRVEAGESCDGADLSGQSCTSLGLGLGTLRCTSACRFDLGGCASCGDGRMLPPEACDRAELGGATCNSAGFPGGGAIACSPACQLDTSRCVARRPGHATLIYATGAALRERRLDTATGAWTAPTTLPAIDGAPAWVVNRISPAGSEELVAASGVKSGLQLFLLRRVNGAWTATSPISSGIPDGEAAKRFFDVVYEASSGEGLLVYSQNTPNPQYRTLAGGAWSAPKSVFSAPPGSSPVRWVVLVSRPATDEIALAYADANMDAYVLTWDGSAFRTAEVNRLSSTGRAYTGTGYDTQSFDVAYGAGGALVALTGEQCCTCAYSSLKKPDAVSFSEGSAACAGSWRVVRLAAQPGGDAIAAAGDLASAGLWNGAAWYPAVSLWPAGVGTSTLRQTDVAWLGSRPEAIIVHAGWPDPPGRGRLHHLRSQPGGLWQRGTAVPVAGLGEVRWVQLRTFPAEERVLAVLSDEQGSLWSASYDATGGWVVGAALATMELPLAPSTTVVPRPFSVDISQPPSP